MNIEMKENINALLDMPLDELVGLANGVRSEFVGDKFELCSILNAKSGICSEDCKFCTQSTKHKTGVEVYPLKDKEEIGDELEGKLKTAFDEFKGIFQPAA